MFKIKPKAEWRHDNSIIAGAAGGAEIRWKADTADGQHRFQVVYLRNRSRPDRFYRSASVTGSVEDALAVVQRFRDEYASLRPDEGAITGVPQPPKSRRKNPKLVLSGRESSQRQWEQWYESVIAAAPKLPAGPAGLPPLKPRIRMRSGYIVDTSLPLWKVDRDFSSRRRLALNLDRLYRPWALGVQRRDRSLAEIPRRKSCFSAELNHAVTLFVARTLEKRTGSQAHRILSELRQLEAFTAGQDPDAVIGPSDLSVGRYRAFARSAGALQGCFVAFYRWCVGQGFPGFSFQVLGGLRRIPVQSAVIGKAIRSSDPRRGALVWEEQLLLSRALANPSPRTHPRDRLIVWLFQELGARPSAIGALKNRHLQATPLGDAYMLHVPRVKQAAPTRDLVPRKISKELGEFIRSVAEGGENDALIPGHLESSWAVQACRAFVAANGIRSPRLVTQPPEGAEQLELLPLTAYRLRYTMGTNLAEQGASAEQIAAMLDDRTLAMALVYTSNTSELVDMLEETLDQHPAWLRCMHLFLGRVGSVENRKLPVIQGGVPYFENYEKYAERISEIGWCSSPQPCELRPPLACYRCGWFVGHPDPGVHLQQLDQLKDEVRTKVGVESDRMAKVLRPDMFAIAELVTLARGGATAGQRIEGRIAHEGTTRKAREVTRGAAGIGVYEEEVR